MTHAIEIMHSVAALEELEMRLLSAGGTILAYSDFDNTLCHSYNFDEAANRRVPQLDPRVIKAAQDVPLLIGTGMLAHNPAISTMWESGLVAGDMPVIAENGGTIIERAGTGELHFTDLITSEEMLVLQGVGQEIKAQLPTLPAGQELTIKAGRTMLVARLRGTEGAIEPHHQAWLATEINKILPQTDLMAVNSRVSVAVQHSRVSKGKAFQYHLDECGLAREDLFVVALGDAPNDETLMDQADLRIGFSDAISEIVDLEMPSGDAQATSDVLRVIGSAAQYELVVKK